MRYHCIHIKTNFAEEWQRDVFDQQICELGVDTIDAEDYYIPSELWQQNADEIERFCAETEGVTLVSSEECPDENWNAAWEAEHPVHELPLGIQIIPHCAFGAGYHETTSMMIDCLMAGSLTDKIVLDHGTGTGVLAIFAKHLGAAKVIAVDIDEKSVTNARENAALNGVDIDVRLADRPLPPDLASERLYNLILANIHRNILLVNMPGYAVLLTPGGELWLSGFYDDDCSALIAAAAQHGLQHYATHASGEWRMLQFRHGLQNSAF